LSTQFYLSSFEIFVQMSFKLVLMMTGFPLSHCTSKQVCSFQTENYRFNLFVGLFGGVLSLKGVSGIIYLSLFCQKKRDRCRADNLQSCYHKNQISQILQKYFQVCKKAVFLF
jgi:hypothetical protein